MLFSSYYNVSFYNFQGKRSSVQDSSDDEQFAKPSKKRRVLKSEDEEDDVENEENNKQSQPKSASKRSASDNFDAKLQAKIDTPKTKVAKKATTKDKTTSDDFDEEPASLEKDSLMLVDSLNKVWAHETLDFLSPRAIRDKNKNRPNDPDYDPRTLHVPQEFLKQQTPAMSQWWILKANHFDCVFFFKVGKFYELFHHDAIIGVKELGFSFMGKNDFAHSGFPEVCLSTMKLHSLFLIENFI